MFFHISTGKNCNLLFETSKVVSDLSDVKTDGGKNSRRLSCNCISSNQGQLYTPAPPKFSTDFEIFLLVFFGMINGAGSCSNLFFTLYELDFLPINILFMAFVLLKTGKLHKALGIYKARKNPIGIQFNIR